MCGSPRVLPGAKRRHCYVQPILILLLICMGVVLGGCADRTKLTLLNSSETLLCFYTTSATPNCNEVKPHAKTIFATDCDLLPENCTT